MKCLLIPNLKNLINKFEELRDKEEIEEVIDIDSNNDQITISVNMCKHTLVSY